MSTVARVIKNIIWGAITAVLYYLTFLVIIPMILSFYHIPIQGEITPTSPYLIFGLILIIAIDTIASIVRFPFSLPLYLSSAAIALFIMGSLVGWGKISREVQISGQTMLINVNASPLIAAIIGISALYAMISSLEKIREDEKIQGE